MRIFLAGATGVVGRHLIPLLREAGHIVVGTTRSPEKGEHLRARGVQAEILDALDRQATVRAVVAARPDAIVHQLTVIPPNLNLRRFDREFALTNRLRTEGTDNLLAAARAAGVRRIVAQSFAGWTYERAGGCVKSEDDPLDPDPPPGFRRTLDAIRYLEAALQAAEGIEAPALDEANHRPSGVDVGDRGPGLYANGTKNPCGGAAEWRGGEQARKEIGATREAMDGIIAECEARFGRHVKLLDHPILGPLTATQWRTLHLVHGRHHLKQLLGLRERAARHMG